MVRGIEVFRDHFRGHEAGYVLIGGVACSLLMDDAGLTFRATKDLDIVLCLEALTPEFVSRFWSFVRAGRYTHHEQATGEPRLYRFREPEIPTYPHTLELFSRRLLDLHLTAGRRLTPIPVGGGVSSLSAILLDHEYYEFILDSRTVVDDVPIVTADCLIPLKARAWLDMTERKKRGEQIDQRDINKHRNDVFRLFQLLEPFAIRVAPTGVVEDVRTFIERVDRDRPNLRQLGIRDIDYSDVVDQLAGRYRTDTVS